MNVERAGLCSRQKEQRARRSGSGLDPRRGREPSAEPPFQSKDDAPPMSREEPKPVMHPLPFPFSDVSAATRTIAATASRRKDVNWPVSNRTDVKTRLRAMSEATSAKRCCSPRLPTAEPLRYALPCGQSCSIDPDTSRRFFMTSDVVSRALPRVNTFKRIVHKSGEGEPVGK